MSAYTSYVLIALALVIVQLLAFVSLVGYMWKFPEIAAVIIISSVANYGTKAMLRKAGEWLRA